MSETSLCRKRLSKYCNGYGLDIGYGGDAIVPHAITVDMPKPYTNVGNHPLNLGGDARDLKWFKDGCLDFVYSSHLLEDFPRNETRNVIMEWMRVLKPGGFLILYLPHEVTYKAHCEKTGQLYNNGHQIHDMSVEYIESVLNTMRPAINFEIVHKTPHVEVYSFEIVIRKL